MEKVNKYILCEIICTVGPFPEILRLSLVCKLWQRLILEFKHYFTLQGVRHPLFIPCNVKIDEILSPFKGIWKLHSLDLRNVQIDVDLLGEVLLVQRNLYKLDLTNSQISVGQVWSHMQANKGKEGFYLEELRLTNNRTVYLGYEALVQVYPNLTKLYVGNTLTSLDNLNVILPKLVKLQLLDVSLCNIDHYDMAHINFRELLQNSELHTIFISEVNETVLEILTSCNVDVIEKTIGDVLLEVTDENSLHLLEEWLDLEGDVNLMCSSNHVLCKLLSVYPQFELVKRLSDENLLREIFKLLINSGLDLGFHTSEPDSGGSILNTAISLQRTGLAHLLISNGSDISPSSVVRNGNPAMTLAAEIGDFSIIQIFLDFGLYNIDYYSPIYCNPICTAAIHGNKELFLFLIEQAVPLFPCPQHPNILITNKNILEMALQSEHSGSFTFPVEMLYEAAQYYIYTQHPEQALLIIESLDCKVKEEEGKILLEKRQSSFRICPDMHKPLIVMATEKKLVPVIKKLVEKGYDINAEDMYGWTAFISACSYGFIDLIPFLCENGALVNKRDMRWRTALHQASQNGHSDVVIELIRYGAALSPECDKGLTPLSYAQINKRTETEKILRDHGARVGARTKKFCNVF